MNDGRWVLGIRGSDSELSNHLSTLLRVLCPQEAMDDGQ